MPFISRHCLSLLAAFALAGCGHVSQTKFDFDADGAPLAHQRRELNVSRDFMHHFSRTAYDKPDFRDIMDPERDMPAVLQAGGPPDWTRRFRSQNNEPVLEWVYLNRAELYQFIGGELVFRGPTADYEKVLLTNGYPDRAISSISDTGRRVDLFVYHKLFGPSIREFEFVDGALVQKDEGY